MIQETGSETEDEPEEINENMKLESIIAKQRSEINMLSENLEIAKAEIKKNELFSNFSFIVVKVFQFRNI